MKASDFDKKFDDGEDITSLLDLEKAKRSSQVQKRINVDMPEWMVRQLDKEAKRTGVTRQSVIKFWLSEKLKETS